VKVNESENNELVKEPIAGLTEVSDDGEELEAFCFDCASSRPKPEFDYRGIFSSQ
jgi:hypothetical protein